MPLPRGAAKEVFEALIRLGQQRVELKLTDKKIAEHLGRTTRYVQKGLKLLQELGILARETIGQHGHRLITFLFRFASSSKPKRTAPPVATAPTSPVAIPPKPLALVEPPDILVSDLPPDARRSFLDQIFNRVKLAPIPAEEPEIKPRE